MLIFFSYIESLDKEVCEENNIEEDLDCLNSEENSMINPLLLWFVYFLAFLHKKQHFLPDTALVLLLRFLSVIFKMLSRLSPQIISLINEFPSTLHRFYNILRIQKEIRNLSKVF